MFVVDICEELTCAMHRTKHLALVRSCLQSYHYPYLTGGVIEA